MDFKKHYVLFLSIISLLLLIGIFQTINYFATNDVIIEKYSSLILSQNSPINRTHSVDLPLTTTYSCKNFCGPTARCAITGQQCFADMDCPGCQPYVPPLSKAKDCVPGDNDAGKLSWGLTPQYSTLTTDMGTRAARITPKRFGSAPQADFGVNTWKTSFREGTKLFDQRYKPNNLLFLPQYQTRPSLTGEFIEDGPLASNAYLK
jgi:hypothetical protein